MLARQITRWAGGCRAAVWWHYWLMTLAVGAAAGGGGDVAALNGLELDLPLDGRFLGLTNAAPPALSLRVRNASDRPQSATVQAVLEIAGNRELTAQGSVTVAAGQTQAVALPLNAVPPFGVWPVRYRLASGPATALWGRDVTAVYLRNRPAPKGRSVFPIGFATGAPRCTPRLLELAATLGFEFHRFEPNWGSVQPRQGEWTWRGVDDYIAQLERVGLRPQPLMHGSVRWAAPAHNRAPRQEAWRIFCAAMANRYQGRVEFWEIWNEPDIGFFAGTVEEYLALQRAAYESIKAAAPREVVTSAGFASLNHGQVKPGIYEAALREYPRAYDWFAYHQHGAFPEFYQAVALQLPALQRSVGVSNVPLVFTETGMDTRHGQRFQALTLMKKLSYAAAIGAQGYVLYNLMDRAGGADTNKPGVTYGLLLNPTGTGRFSEVEHAVRPKEAFVAVAQAIRELRDRPPLGLWAQDGRTFVFLFGRPGDYLLAGWQEDRRTPEPVMAVDCGDQPGLRVARVDVFGNETPLAARQGVVLAHWSEPAYLRITGGAAPPKLLGPALQWPQLVTPAAGGEAALEVRVLNPFAAPVVSRLRVNLPEGAAAPPVERRLARGETGRVPLRFAVGERRFGEVAPVTVTAQWDDLPPVTVRVPVVFNVLDAAQGARLALREMTHVVNKNEHDPHTIHLLWRGAADLSVQAALDHEAATDTLRLRLEVTDDAHHAVLKSGAVLTGDAVELGWRTASGATGRVELAGVPGQPPVVAAHPAGLAAAVRAEVAREGRQTTYQIALNLAALGLTPADRREGVAFNFAVHDHDGAGAKSWISPAPGLGGAAQFNPAAFPRLRLR